MKKMRIALDNPYQAKGQQVWLKGNLHTHSTRSDGVREPQEVINAYARYGHDFLAFSDHDQLAEFRGLDPKGLILIMGNEVSSRGCHILDIGARTTIAPNVDRQKVIDEINAKSGFAIINHPNWTANFNHCTYEQLLALRGYAGIEILNGGCVTAPGSGYALEKWDRLLSSGRLVWGYANDDSHEPRHENLAFNVVQVPAGRVNAGSIVNALRKGSFYASSGVSIDRIAVDGCKLNILARQAQGFAVIGDNGAQLAFVEGPVLNFDAGHVVSSYIRVQVFGRRPQQYAWTQPFRMQGQQLAELLAAKPVFRAARLPALSEIPALDAPVWNKVRQEPVSLLGVGSAPAELETTARCLVAAGHVILKVRCQEPSMRELRLRAQLNSPHIWTGDSLEIFLDVEGRGKNYFQIMLDPRGSIYSQQLPSGVRKPRCRVQTCREKDAWTVQVAIDIGSLGSTPALKAGSRWGFNLVRNRRAANAKQTLTWKWTGGSNHCPEAFGWLRL